MELISSKLFVGVGIGSSSDDSPPGQFLSESASVVVDVSFAGYRFHIGSLKARMNSKLFVGVGIGKSSGAGSQGVESGTRRIRNS
jgi:hypothetical protein